MHLFIHCLYYMYILIIRLIQTIFYFSIFNVLVWNHLFTSVPTLMIIKFFYISSLQYQALFRYYLFTIITQLPIFMIFRYILQNCHLWFYKMYV